MLRSLQFSPQQPSSPGRRFPIQNKRTFEFKINQSFLNHQILKRNYSTFCTWFITDTVYFRSNKKFLIRHPKQVKLIQKLHVACLSCEKKGLSQISQCFKGFVALKRFKFIASSYDISKKELRPLGKVLKRLSSVESLDLCFKYCNSMTDKRLKILSKNLGALISLKTLVLDFSNCSNITDSGIHALCKGMKNLVFIRSVNLVFSECQQIRDEGLQAIQKLLKKLKYLREVNLDFKGCTFSVCEVDRVIRNLKTSNLSKRMRIDFDLHSCQIVVNGPKQASSSHLVFFQMKFSFRDTKIELYWLEIFWSKYAAFRSVHLEFAPFYNINDLRLKYLCQSLKTIVSLQSLSFRFPNLCEITDEGLKHLSQFVKGSTNLQDINFDFSWCQNMTDQGWQYLSKGLELLCSLQNLHLGFPNTNQVTDMALYNFSKSLKEMVSLQKLSFDFSVSLQISSSGIQHVIQSLNELASLQEFTIKIHDIWDKNIKRLKDHQSLQKVNLYVGNSLQIIEIWRHRNDEAEKEKMKPRRVHLESTGVVEWLKKIKRSLWRCCEGSTVESVCLK